MYIHNGCRAIDTVQCQFGLTAMKMKKTNILNDKETFLSAKSWIFTSVILWGADNKIEKKATLSQKTRVIYLELPINRNTVNCRRFWLKVLSPASLRKSQN
jgi:hypothetical protein